MSTLLAAQSGVVSRRQLLERGAPPSDLTAALRHGRLVRPRPGVLADAARWRGASVEERYRLTVRGILLAHPTWVASHHAAASLHGLPTWGVDLRVIDVVADVTTSKIRPGLHVHPWPTRLDPVVASDLPEAVTAAVACVQIAGRSGAEPGVVALDAALHRGLCRREDVQHAIDAGVVRYGRAQAERMLELAEPSCESVGETRARLLLEGLGFAVDSQVPVLDAEGRFVARVDFLIGRVVVEFDGAVKYAGADGREALVAEKVREDALRALGYVVVRLSWQDLDHPAAVARRIERALALAG